MHQLWEKFIARNGHRFRLLRAAVKSIMSRDVDLICGYLSYTTILSIIPIIVLMLVVGKMFGNPEQDTYTLANRFLDLITPEGAEHLRHVISDLYQSVKVRRFGITATVPLLLLVFQKIRVLREAFGKLVGEGPRISIFLELIIFVVIIITLPLAFSMLDSLVLSQIPQANLFFLSDLSKLAASFVIISLLMRIFLPSRTPKQIELYMALLGAILLTAGNRLFGYISSQFFHTSHMYGVFASVPLFLVWIYIFWRVLVSCVILASGNWRPH